MGYESEESWLEGEWRQRSRTPGIAKEGGCKWWCRGSLIVTGTYEERRRLAAG